MSIRPIEFSGIVSRSQDITTLKQNQDNKPMIDQNNIQSQVHKKIDDHLHQVHQADDAEQQKYRYDAKEKGNNSYNQKKKQSKKQGEITEKIEKRVKTTGFDIKI